MGNARCIMQKDRAIGAQENFADTFNWLVKFCDNLTGEDGIEVDHGDDNHPKIRFKPEEAEDEETGGETVYNFKSATDSNVTFEVTQEEDNSRTVTVGVYYV